MTAYAGEDVEQREHSSIACRSANLYSHFGNQYGDNSETWDLSALRPHDTTLGHIPKNAQSYHKDTCLSMFTAVLFVIAMT